jgi:peroxiredoxin
MKKLLLCMVAAAAVAGAEEFKLGSAIHDFEVTGAKGEQVSYSALKGDTTVVIFVSTACPISNSYNDRMKAVYNEYAAKGVHFVFVNANNNEPAAEVAEHAKAHGFPFMVYKDATGAVANLFGAQVTPENEARVRNQGLRLALDAVLAGKAVPVAQTKAFGCTIKRRRREL